MYYIFFIIFLCSVCVKASHSDPDMRDLTWSYPNGFHGDKKIPSPVRTPETPSSFYSTPSILTEGDSDKGTPLSRRSMLTGPFFQLPVFEYSEEEKNELAEAVNGINNKSSLRDIWAVGMILHDARKGGRNVDELVELFHNISDQKIKKFFTDNGTLNRRAYYAFVEQALPSLAYEDGDIAPVSPSKVVVRSKKSKSAFDSDTD